MEPVTNVIHHLPRPLVSPFHRVFDATGDEETAPVARLASLVLSELIRSNHKRMSVRFVGDRISIQFGTDDQSQDVMKLPAITHGPFVNRLKVMANLDIAKRPSQNGTLYICVDGAEYALAIRTEVNADGSEDAALAITASAAP